MGNSGVDRLFGDSGLDTFVAESSEVRDLDSVSGETITSPPTGEAASSARRVEDDPVVEFADPRLMEAVANALGSPS